jgi:hypothetical protein
MPSRYPTETRRQVVDLARSGTREVRQRIVVRGQDLEYCANQRGSRHWNVGTYFDWTVPRRAKGR